MTDFPDEARWWLPAQGFDPGRVDAAAAPALLRRLAEHTRAAAGRLGYGVAARWPDPAAPADPTDYGIADPAAGPAGDALDALAGALGPGLDAAAVAAAWRATAGDVAAILGRATAAGDWTLAAAAAQELLERALTARFAAHLAGLGDADAARAAVRRVVARHLPNAGWAWTIGAVLWGIRARADARPRPGPATPPAPPPPRRDAVYPVPGPSAGAWSKRFVVDYKPVPPAWPRWTLDDARAFVERVGLGLLPIEYGMALFGSVLRNGVGNDLDAVVFPIVADPRYATRDALALVETLSGGAAHLKFVKSANCAQYHLALPCGRAVDFQVWCVVPYPPEVGPP